MSWLSRRPLHLLLASLPSLASLAAVADDQPKSLPISVPVKSLSLSQPESSPPSGARPASLPDQRLPQYQMGNPPADAVSQLEKENGEIRFILAAPAIVDSTGRPLLIRIAARIDGQSFWTTRDQKAETLLASLASTDKPADRQTDQSTTTDNEDDSDVNEKGEHASDETTSPPAGARGPAYQLATDLDENLRRYREAIGERVSKDEVGWLLNHWSDGPSLLLLHPYFQRFRADQRPAYRLLDRDRDGTVSQQELSAAAESFQKCDVNRDDIVDVLEIAKLAGSQDSNKPSRQAAPLLLTPSDLKPITQDDSSFAGVFTRFDLDQDGRMGASDIDAVRTMTPDIELLAEFDTKHPDKSKLTLAFVAEQLQPRIDTPTFLEGINIRIGDATFNFSAVQSKDADQVSLGAVVDGYPLLPTLDPNDDGRLTIRELRGLDSRLRGFDVDGDGRLTSEEARSPIRICVGLGPIVHRQLSGVRTTKATDQPKATVGPAWFVRMDRNADNDLTRSEFPGTAQQFESLDADSDQLISADEALRSDKQSSGSL